MGWSSELGVDGAWVAESASRGTLATGSVRTATSAELGSTVGLGSDVAAGDGLAAGPGVGRAVGRAVGAAVAAGFGAEVDVAIGWTETQRFSQAIGTDV